MRFNRFAPLQIHWSMSLMAVLIGSGAVIVSVLPWPWHNSSIPRPAILLLLVGWWELHRPEGFPAGIALGLGVVHDILASGILGMSVLPQMVSVCIHKLVRKKATPSLYLARWMTFCLLGGIYFILSWVLWALWAQTYLHNIATPDILETLGRYLSTLVCYTVISIGLEFMFGSASSAEYT